MSEELKQLLESLKDPEAVLVNMMRGTIATPSARAISKLFGDVINGEDEWDQIIDDLQAGSLNQARGNNE